MNIDIYTDGGCFGNPGPGAWAYVAVIAGKRERSSGYEAQTTNNRMELTAVIEGLRHVAGRDVGKRAKVRVLTDSQYVQKGITEWVAGWVRKNWRTSSGTPVKNQDLWKRLLSLTETREVRWEWVRGHVGNELNEICDAMVKEEIMAHRDARTPRAPGGTSPL